MTVYKEASYRMTYRGVSTFPASSVGAGIICQRVADTAEECGYPNCRGEVVGAAVHGAIIKKADKSGYIDGSKSLPVCQRHKEWEYAKLTNAQPWGTGYYDW